MTNKVCPIMSGKELGIDKCKCLEGFCTLWVTMYTTENLRITMCAFEAMALKNSEGKIPV